MRPDSYLSSARFVVDRSRIHRLLIIALVVGGVTSPHLQAANPYPSVPGIDVLLQKKTRGSVRPIFVARSRNSGQILLLSGLYPRRKASPVRPTSLQYFDRSNPTAALSVSFNSVGDPVRIKLVGGARLDLQIVKRTGFVRGTLRDPRGRLIVRNDQFAPLAVTSRRIASGVAEFGRSAARAPRVEYHTPWQIRPDQSATTEEIEQGAGAENAPIISDLLNFLSDSANDYLSRARDLAATAASTGLSVATALGYVISDGLGILYETTQSVAVRIVQVVYDLKNDIGSVVDYIRSPDANGLADALDTASDLANQAQDTVESVTVLMDGQNNVTDIDDPTGTTNPPPPPPTGSDTEKHDQVMQFSQNVSNALGGVGDCFRLADIILGGVSIPFTVERMPSYFTSMNLFSQQCGNVAAIANSMTSGSNLRNQARSTVANLRQSLINNVTSQIAMVQGTRDGNLNGLSQNNTAIANQNAYIVTLQNAGQPQFVIDQAIQLRDDMIARGQMYVDNMDACDLLKIELNSQKAQLEAIVIL